MVETQGEMISQARHQQGQNVVQTIETHSEKLGGLLEACNHSMAEQLKQTNLRLDQNVAERTCISALKPK